MKGSQMRPFFIKYDNMVARYSICKIIQSLDEVPEDWIYKYYYRLCFQNNPLKGIIHQPFDGRIIKVKSFANRDSDPSLCFFYKHPHYFWKDFSSGRGGNAKKFAAYVLNKTESAAETNILFSYENFLNDGGVSYQPTITNLDKPKFSAIVKPFTEYALKDFSQYGISLSSLNYFNIKELDKYNIKKGSVEKSCVGYSFGFFSNEKGLYQIYSPNYENKENHTKYYYVDPTYLIGSDQLEFKSDTCLIISGLKDIAAIRDLNLDAEYVAGLSETALLDKKTIDWLKSKYKFLLSMLDNDKGGINSMRRYKIVYDIDYIHINLEKDLAENNKYYAPEYLREFYTINIDKKINH